MFYILLLTVGAFAAQPAMPAIRDYPNVPCIPYATFNTLLEETSVRRSLRRLSRHLVSQASHGS